ncbi:MAG: hypothetical protein PVH61_33265 [Candidatus Aminicenantes bacterium]|jgi:hypothetical protein
MTLQEQILEFIDRYLSLLTLHEILQIKTNKTINIIASVIKESNKTIPEAVSVFLTVVRYLRGENHPGSLQKFIEDNSRLIFKMTTENRAQCNIPHRALPLFEVFEEKIKSSPVSVIELGASYGLIGRCLLNPQKIMEKKNVYFPRGQQMPRNPRPVDYYLGLELSPPGEEWLLAGEWHPMRRERLKNFLHDIPTNKKFKLQKGNAFGFSKQKAVKDLDSGYSTVVVLTSFMFYQYEEKKQQMLREEILEYTRRTNGHWINQASNESLLKGFVEFDGEKIIELPDSTFNRWKWLEKSVYT